MGYIKHNAMIITSDGYSEAMTRFDKVYNKAKELFDDLVSEPIKSNMNGYISFFIAPDGSKEGWDVSDEGDSNRKILCAYIDSLSFEDGSNAIKYVDVSYDEEHDTEVEKTNPPLNFDEME